MSAEIENLRQKIQETEDEIKEVKNDLKQAKKEKKPADASLKNELTSLKNELTSLENKLNLHEIENKIENLTNSEKYKLLAEKNRVWALPKPTDEEKEEWKLLQEQLAELKADKKFLQDLILNSTASSVRKQDSVRKGYKNETATKSERDVLSTIAEHLFSLFNFDTKYAKGPTFGDVMEATKFYSISHILHYFSPQKRKENSGDIREFFGKDEWIYLVELNDDVNSELHSRLDTSNDKITIVLKSKFYNPKRLTGIMERVELDTTKLDIKNADSDSSTGGSPTTEKKLVA